MVGGSLTCASAAGAVKAVPTRVSAASLMTGLIIPFLLGCRRCGKRLFGLCRPRCGRAEELCSVQIDAGSAAPSDQRRMRLRSPNQLRPDSARERSRVGAGNPVPPVQHVQNRVLVVDVAVATKVAGYELLRC